MWLSVHNAACRVVALKGTTLEAGWHLKTPGAVVTLTPRSCPCMSRIAPKKWAPTEGERADLVRNHGQLTRKVRVTKKSET